MVEEMRNQKSGHIVSISTVLVDQSLAGAMISLPVLTKSAIPEFNRALAMELVAVLLTPIPAKDDHEILKKLQLLVRGCIALFGIGTNGEWRFQTERQLQLT
jgi:hypothetical protein